MYQQLYFSIYQLLKTTVIRGYPTVIIVALALVIGEPKLSNYVTVITNDVQILFH